MGTCTLHDVSVDRSKEGKPFIFGRNNQANEVDIIVQTRGNHSLLQLRI